MTIQQFRETLQKQPFNPFHVHLADGRSVPVKSPEFVAQSPSGRSVIVYYGQDHYEIIDLLLVTTLQVGKGKRGVNGSRN